MTDANRKTLPVSDIWDQTRAFVRRESHLLLPTSMGTIALGQAGIAFGSSLSEAGWPGGSLILVLIGLLLVVFGQLAITALALKPGLSVGEAMAIAVNRMPRMIGFGLMVALGVFLLMLPLAVYLAAIGVKGPDLEGGLPPGASLYVVIVIGLLIWVSIRYYTLGAQIVDEDARLSAAMEGSFKASRGVAAAILGVLALFLMLSLVVQAVVQLLFGILFTALGKMLGVALLPEMMVALATGMAAAMIGLYSTVFTAFVWRHLSR